MSEVAHPAPHRAGTGFWALMFGCCTAPIFWLGQLGLGYWVSAQICYGSDHPTVTAAPGLLRIALIAFDVTAVIAALAGAFVSFVNWRATRDENGDAAHPTAHIAQGRSRFMALWGTMSSLWFLGAILFNTIASLVAPLCTP